MFFVRFTKWWPGWTNDTKESPLVGFRPLCIVMKREFPCYERLESTCETDYFFWDSEDCAASSRGHSFVCERPYDDIGIIGKIIKFSTLSNTYSTGQKFERTNYFLYSLNKSEFDRTDSNSYIFHNV